MSAETLHPHSALPAGGGGEGAAAAAVDEQGVMRGRVDKWNTSPGGPLERHVQASSGENGGQTSSGEHCGEPGSDQNSLMEEEEEHQQQQEAAAVMGGGPASQMGVDCTVELVPMPGAGSSGLTDPGGGGPGEGDLAGSTVRTTLNLASLTSFDALHCSFASVVGAPPPAGGRHDPSALQVVYCDVSGAPTVLGGESWQIFLSRARSVHARLLVPMEEHKKQRNNNASSSEGVTMAAPAPAPAPASAPAAQGILPPPFAEMQAQWATMGLDPNIMMAMMMYAAAASAGSYPAPQ